MSFTFLDQLAETRIQQALETGAFDDLPGTGKPLALETDLLVPEELRVAYRLLKNADFLPPEIQLRKDIIDAETLLTQVQDSTARNRAQRRLERLRLHLACSRRKDSTVRFESAYYDKLLNQIE
jgi:hypothetical protein